MQSIVNYSNEELAEIDQKLMDNFKQPRFVWEQEFMEMNEFMRKLNHYFYKYAVLGLPIAQNNWSRVIPYSTMLGENKRTQIVGSDIEPNIRPDMLAKDYDQAIDEAMFKQTKLEKIWRDNSFKIRVSDIVLDGVDFNVGFLKVYTDELGDIRYKRVDWRDMFFYPTVWDLSESPIVGRRFTGIIAEYEAKEDWDMEGVVPQHLYQDDISRNAGISMGHPQPQESPIFNLNLFEGKEWETQVYVDDALKKRLQDKYAWIRNKKNGQKVTRQWVVVQGKTRYETWLDYDRSSVFSFCPQSAPLYGKSMASRLVGTNKSYDNIISHVEMFIAFANKYRLLVEKGSEVNDVDNVNAQKLLYRGTKPEVLKQDQLSVTVFDYMVKLEQTMQVLMNTNVPAVTSISGGKSKGSAFAAQKEQDLFNTSYAVDKFILFLNDVAKFTLKILASNTEIEDIAYNDGLENKKAVIMGKNYKKYMEDNTAEEDLPDDWDKAIVITGDEDVEVTIQEGSGFTQDEIELVAGLVKSDPQDYPPELIPYMLQDPKLDYYLQIAKKRAAAQKQKEAQQQQQQQQLEQQAQAQQQNAGNAGNGQQQPGMPGQNGGKPYNPQALKQAIAIMQQLGIQPPQPQQPQSADDMQQQLNQ